MFLGEDPTYSEFSTAISYRRKGRDGVAEV